MESLTENPLEWILIVVLFHLTAITSKSMFTSQAPWILLKCFCHIPIILLLMFFKVGYPRQNTENNLSCGLIGSFSFCYFTEWWIENLSPLGCGRKQIGHQRMAAPFWVSCCLERFRGCQVGLSDLFILFVSLNLNTVIKETPPSTGNLWYCHNPNPPRMFI